MRLDSEFFEALKEVIIESIEEAVPYLKADLKLLIDTADIKEANKLLRSDDIIFLSTYMNEDGNPSFVLGEKK